MESPPPFNCSSKVGGLGGGSFPPPVLPRPSIPSLVLEQCSGRSVPARRLGRKELNEPGTVGDIPAAAAKRWKYRRYTRSFLEIQRKRRGNAARGMLPWKCRTYFVGSTRGIRRKPGARCARGILLGVFPERAGRQSFLRESLYGDPLSGIPA